LPLQEKLRGIASKIEGPSTAREKWHAACFSVPSLQRSVKSLPDTHVGFSRATHRVKPRTTVPSEENIMLSWALTFLVIALIAAVLGFGGLAGAAAGIAKILFFVFLVIFVVSLIAGTRRPVV
jgi:uncharacterized membrane protein YtjA (UPF0391 family)